MTFPLRALGTYSHINAILSSEKERSSFFKSCACHTVDLSPLITRLLAGHYSDYALGNDCFSFTSHQSGSHCKAKLTQNPKKQKPNPCFQTCPSWYTFEANLFPFPKYNIQEVMPEILTLFAESEDSLNKGSLK